MATEVNITPTADMPPVATSTQGTSSSQSQSGIEQSPEAAQADRLESESLKAQAGFQAAQGEAQAAASETQAQGHDQQAALLLKQAAEAQKVRENYLQRIEYAQTQAARARVQFEDFQFHSYWSSLATGQRIQSRIAAGLGGFASGVNGGPNYVLQKLTDDANRDFEMQKQQLSKKERSADWAMKGVTDLYGQMQHDLAALEIKHGLALKAVAEKAQAALTRAGIPVAQAASDATVHGLLAGAYAKERSAAERYEAHYDRQQQQHAQEQVTTAKGGTQAQMFDAAGTPIGATNKESATKFNTEAAALQQAHEQLQILKDSFKGGVVDSAAEFQKRQAAQTELKTLMPQIKGFTRLTKEDMEAFDKIVGGTVDSLTGFGAQRLEQLQKSLEGATAAHLSSNGVRPNPGLVRRMLDPDFAKSSSPVSPGALTREQILDKIKRTNRYLADNPGADDAADARKSLAELHVQLARAK